MKFKQVRPLGPNAAHGRTVPLDPALLRPAKPAHSKTEPGPTQPSFHGCFGTPGETGEGIAPPDASGSPMKFDQPTAGAGEEIAVAQAREEEELNLGFCTEGGSAVWARGGGELDRRESSGERSEGCSSVRKERSVRYPRARWCSGRRRRGQRWGVGGWHRGGVHHRGKQSAAGGRGLRAGARSQGGGLCFSFGP
jgi:hypothetical protein